jgi:putative tricarboxylic transport membrane protein
LVSIHDNIEGKVSRQAAISFEWDMNLRNKSDLVSGACLAAFGVYLTVASSRLAYVSEHGPGPGFMPLWLGIGLIVLTLSLIAIDLARPNLERAHKSGTWPVARALGGWIAVMVGIMFLPRLGFSLSLALLTIFLVVVLDRRSFWTALGVGFGLALSFYVVFVLALGLSLPSGPWGF